MYCIYCGKKLEDTWKICPYCGKEVRVNTSDKIEKEENLSKVETVENEKRELEEKRELADEHEPKEKRKPEEALELGKTQTDNIPEVSSYKYKRKSFWKYFGLSLITCGLYSLYFWHKYVRDINEICKNDGKDSDDYFVVIFLSIVTLGIYGWYWRYTQAERLYNAGKQYGVPIREKGSTVLIWTILSIITGSIGGFTAQYILIDNLNCIALRNRENVSENIPNHPHLKRNAIIASIVYIVLVLLIALTLFGVIIGGINEKERTVDSSETVQQDEKEQMFGAQAQDDSEKSNVEKGGNILRGEAKDSNDLTGTYIDEENGMMLQIIVQGDTATYSLSNLDGTEAEVEQNCEITDNYFGGELYYFSLNLDGTLAISSGVGGTWGRFVKTSNKAEIDLSYDIGNYSEETAESNDKYDTSTPLGKLKSCANESGCTRGYFEREHGNNSDWSEHIMEMEDDGSYFDEVVLGAWFNSDGTPVADYPPKKLWKANYMFNLARFYFLDGETNSLDALKRGNPSDMNTYALVLTNIQKGSSFGDGYFQGWDYISKEPVIVHGNFNGLMNGDNVLVFATYNGLASDDTPNFKGFHVEVINARGIQ